jgi:hypothetical protein
MMSKEKVYEYGFDDKYMGDHNGQWDAWFISDLLCLFNGHVVCTSKNYVEVATEDYKKRICIYVDKGKFITYINLDDLNKYSYTQRDYLAFQGFCNKYNFKYEEWCDE